MYVDTYIPLHKFRFTSLLLRSSLRDMPTIDSIFIILSTVESFDDLYSLLITSRLFRDVAIRLPFYKRYLANIKPRSFILLCDIRIDRFETYPSIHYACKSNNIDMLTFLSQKGVIGRVHHKAKKLIEQYELQDNKNFHFMYSSLQHTFGVYIESTMREGSVETWRIMIREFQDIIDIILGIATVQDDDTVVRIKYNVLDTVLMGGSFEIIRYACETYKIPSKCFSHQHNWTRPILLISRRLEPEAFVYLIEKYSIDVEKNVENFVSQTYNVNNVKLCGYLIRTYESIKKYVSRQYYFDLKFMAEKDVLDMFLMMVKELCMSRDDLVRNNIVGIAYSFNSTKIITYLERNILV